MSRILSKFSGLFARKAPAAATQRDPLDRLGRIVRAERAREAKPRAPRLSPAHG